MQRISTHIEELLFFNDCVIIPDFGGFVLQIHPAVYVSSNHMFSPPYKEILFNPTLNHNDGLLSESYMQTYDMDFNEAQAAVKSDMEALKKELDENGSVSLGAIGVFRKYNEALIFEPSTTVSAFNITSYGLTTFYLPPIQVADVEGQSKMVESEESHTKQKTEHNVYSSSVNKILSRIAGVAAAAIALFLLISTPVKDVNMSAYTASFIPSEMIPRQQVLQKGAIGEEETTGDNTEPVVSTADADQLTASHPSSLPSRHETEEVRKQSPIIPEIESVVARTYYVIVASFETKTQLNKFLSNADLSTLKNVGVVQNSERIRVYADKTNDRKDAEAYIHLLRENEKYKDAWLFVGR